MVLRANNVFFNVTMSWPRLQATQHPAHTTLLSLTPSRSPCHPLRLASLLSVPSLPWCLSISSLSLPSHLHPSTAQHTTAFVPPAVVQALQLQP
jgi:hypothetical protein